jgi:hypothetical protein
MAVQAKRDQVSLGVRATVGNAPEVVNTERVRLGT